MDGQMIIQFLTEYGYWIYIPLAIALGPIVAIVAAFMASVGIFNVYIILLLSIIGDLIGDLLFYGIGRRWGMGFVRHIGKYIGITATLVQRLQRFFIAHGGKTIFMVKSTTGLCWATFITAGIVHMPIRRFVAYSFFGGIIWSGFLVILGYFFGYMYGRIAQYIEYAGWLIFVIATMIMVVVYVLKRKKSYAVFSSVVDR